MNYNDNLLGTLPDTHIAKITNKTVQWVYRRRKKLGIDKFSGGLTPRYNVCAFDKIDYISAYWLGVYFSDGNICKTTYNRHTINIKSKDCELIKKLMIFFNIVKNPLRDKRSYYYLSLCNKHLFNRLHNLNCVERKSKILNPPKIKDKYFWSFLMGVFDGDGSISLNKANNQWKVSIGTGSINFANWIKLQMKNMNLYPIFEKTKTKTKQKKDFYNVVLVGKAGLIFLDKIYSSVDNYLPLQRKKKLYKKMCTIKKWKGPNFFDWEIDILMSCKTLKDVSKLISSNDKNWGWVRSEGSLRHKRLSLTRNLRNL